MTNAAAVVVALGALLALADHATFRQSNGAALTSRPAPEPVTFTLDCVDASHLRFELRNEGRDVVLPLGAEVGKDGFIATGLSLVITRPDVPAMKLEYEPSRLRPGIGGGVRAWLEPLPAESVFGMLLAVYDFYRGPAERMTEFPRGSRLTLKWTLPPPPPEQNSDLPYWSGTLTSNSCSATAQ